MGYKLKNNKSGIVMINEIKISPYTCERLPLMMSILQIIFMVLSVSSVLCAFANSIGIYLDNILFYSVLTVLSVIEYCIFLYMRSNRKNYFMYGYMILVVIYAILRAKFLKASLLAIISKYYKYYNDYYGTSYIITGVKSGEYITEVFLLIAIFMSIIVGYIITCYMIRGLYFIVTLPWICLCYIAGLTGEGKNMLIYIVITYALFCSGSVKDNYCVRNRINLRGNNYKQKNFKDIAAIKIGVSMMILISIIILLSQKQALYGVKCAEAARLSDN